MGTGRGKNGKIIGHGLNQLEIIIRALKNAIDGFIKKHFQKKN